MGTFGPLKDICGYILNLFSRNSLDFIPIIVIFVEAFYNSSLPRNSTGKLVLDLTLLMSTSLRIMSLRIADNA